MDFLTLIEKLRDFWKKQGCVLWCNQNLEVGAGTFNHATFFGVLGDQSTKVAYLEPCRRPTDGRYGKNPNRLQQYFQFQVILKPAPENGQNLYLESLRSLGVSFAKNDLRFVKDDWKSPTLGAAGLGWEVWLNGMEITQFTYFQQMAGQSLMPVSLEITYGLERIFLAMEAQKNTDIQPSQTSTATATKASSGDVLSIYDLPFNGKSTYGDAFLQREEQYSKYNFEVADTQSHLQMFSALENEAKLCCEHKLPYPAYDNVIKCSHIFNMLDARGVISVTERENYISRIRRLATETALAYTTDKVSKQDETSHTKQEDYISKANKLLTSPSRLVLNRSS